jgi:hypothetical protein
VWVVRMMSDPDDDIDMHADDALLDTLAISTPI